MESQYFRFADFVVEVSHPQDPLYCLIAEEFEIYRADPVPAPEALLVRKDFDKRRVGIDYRRDGELVLAFARTAFKWLVTKTAELRGHAYLHASGARYRGMNILFAAHPSYGKSSCLYRLLNDGATPICEDAALVKDGVVASFCSRASVKGDFAGRFGVDEGRPRLPVDPSGAGYLGRVDLIFLWSLCSYGVVVFHWLRPAQVRA